jgi:hypothetical protein
MNKLAKIVIICILAVGLALPARGLDVSPYHLIFGESRWQTKINNFMDAVAGLGNLVANYIVSVDALTLIQTTPTFSDNHTFTLAGDFRTLLTTGKRLVADCGVDGLKPNTVASCTYAAPTSTVVVNTANLTANLAAVSYYAARNGINTYGSGDIVTGDYGAPSWALFSAAAGVANITGRRLLVTPGNWPISDNLIMTVPVNIVPGAILEIADTKTLTLNVAPEAGRWQVFSCTGTGAVALPVTETAYPQWWGTNVTASVNAALASGAGVVDLGSQTYTIATTVLWDVSKCDLRGNGAKFDATGNSGIAIQASNGSATANVFYPWSKRRSGGFEIEGDKTTYAACVGLEVNGSYEISGLRLYNVVAHGFNIALNLDLPSYIYGSSFRDCAFYDSVYAVKAAHGGETITFDKSLFFNSTYGFYASDGGHWTLNDCHIDYTTQAVYAAGSARVTLNNPFIESNTDTTYWLKCSGSSSSLVLKNGIIVNTCATPKTYEIGLADQCGSEGIVLDGTLMSAFTSANYGVKDVIKVTDYTGAVQFRGLRPYMTSAGLTDTPTARLMLSSHLNYLSDGGFETAYTTDWTASSGAGYTAPALDATEHHGGAKSLKFAPTVGNQTQIIRSIPCRVGEWGRMSFWIKQDFSTSTDTFRIEAGYLAADGSEIPNYSNVIDLSQATTHYDTWTQLWITAYYPAPAGAVSAYFKFKVGTAASDGNGETYIDDVQINMWLN